MWGIVFLIAGSKVLLATWIQCSITVSGNTRIVVSGMPSKGTKVMVMVIPFDPSSGPKTS